MGDSNELVNAIVQGDAKGIESTLNSILLSKIANRIDDMRQEVAQNIFPQYQNNDDAFLEESKKRRMAKPSKSNAAAMRKYTGPQSTGYTLPKNLADLTAEDEAKAIGQN